MWGMEKGEGSRMKAKSSKARLTFTEDGQAELILTIPNSFNIRHEFAEVKEIISKGKELTVDIKQFRQARSLDSNAYLWVMLSKMANVLKTTKDELYLRMLNDYGVFTHVVVKPNVVDRVMQEWRIVRNLGEVTINGKVGVQLQCYFGSSTYDSKEMSTLVEGVVYECKELGIDTMTPNEIADMNSRWGEERKVS